MDERQILTTAAMEVAQLRYQAYVLYEENRRLSFEIEFRIKAVSDLINARIAELTHVIHHHQCNVKEIVENKFSALRTMPKIDYTALSTIRANAISPADSCKVVPFYRH